MAKINLDKYYTPSDLAEYCVKKTKEVIGVKNITEWLEPSAGAGVFLPYLDNNYLAFDIEPEAENIEQKNYLELDLPYLKGRCVIGNPPFGDRNNLARSFYKHACKMGDYIGFILPISQFENSDSLYHFDLIKSIDLGILEYSGMKIHCCFNLYQRPKNGKLNSKPKLSSGLFVIYRDDQDGYNKLDYDLCIFRRGASIGKEKFTDTHTQTYKIVVKNKSDVDYVRSTILNFDWHNFKKHQSAPSISKNDILRLFLNGDI